MTKYLFCFMTLFLLALTTVFGRALYLDNSAKFNIGDEVCVMHVNTPGTVVGRKLYDINRRYYVIELESWLGNSQFNDTLVFSEDTLGRDCRRNS